MGQESSAPDGFRIGRGPIDDYGRQAANRAAATVQQSCLAGQGFAVADNTDHVAAAPAQAAP